jgi:hypothetical protein
VKYDPIIIDGEEFAVTEEMIFGGSYSCMTCEAPSDTSINIGGTLYWVCPAGHNNKVVLYE